jgi:hypothetical protein
MACEDSGSTVGLKHEEKKLGYIPAFNICAVTDIIRESLNRYIESG